MHKSLYVSIIVVHTWPTYETERDKEIGRIISARKAIKQQITPRLDADLIDWFKTHHPQPEGYQTSINRALREYIAQQKS